MKEKFQIDLFCYYDWLYDTWDVIANPITSYNFIIIEKLTELLLGCYVYCCHSSKSIFPFHFWLMYENFYFRLEKKRLFSTYFMVLRNFCFLFLNWQHVIVSHDSQ